MPPEKPEREDELESEGQEELEAIRRADEDEEAMRSMGLPDFTVELNGDGLRVVGWEWESLPDVRGVSFETVPLEVERISTDVVCTVPDPALPWRERVRANAAPIRTALHHALLKAIQISGHYRRPIAVDPRSVARILTERAPVALRDAYRFILESGGTLNDLKAAVSSYELTRWGIQTMHNRTQLNGRALLYAALEEGQILPGVLRSTEMHLRDNLQRLATSDDSIRMLRSCLERSDAFIESTLESDDTTPSEKAAELRERSLLGFSEDFVRSVAPELIDCLPDPVMQPDESNALFARLCAAAPERCPDKQTFEAPWVAWGHDMSRSLAYKSTSRYRVFRFQFPSLSSMIRSTRGTPHPVDVMWFPGTTLHPNEERVRARRDRERSLKRFDLRNGDVINTVGESHRIPRLLSEGASAMRALRDSVIDGNLRVPFEGLFLDVDGVLVEKYDDPTSPVATRLRALATAGIPIAICSGGPLKRIEELLDPPSAYPGLVIYGEHGGKCVRSDGVSWVEMPGTLEGLTEGERADLHASYVEVATRAKKRVGLSEQSCRLVNNDFPKPDSFAVSVSSLHRRDQGSLAVPRARLARLARELQEADDRAIEKLPGGFQAYMNGTSVQIIPKVLTKEACLVHFSALLREAPGRRDPLGRIMRIGDQGSALEGRDDRYTPVYLPVVGVDTGILSCADGFSTLYESEHGNPPPADEMTGRPLIKTEATCWLLDRASFRLNEPREDLLDAVRTTRESLGRTQPLNDGDADVPKVERE